MTIEINATATVGQSLTATIQQSTGGTLGDTWNVTTGAWASSVADGDAKITLTEGAGRLAGSYDGGIATALGSYTGDVLVRVHDSGASDAVIGSQKTYLLLGVEQSVGAGGSGGSSVSPSIISQDRTWMLRDAGEYATAPEVVWLAQGTTATLSFDFTHKLNPTTDLLSVDSVIVDEVQSGTAPGTTGQALSQNRKQVHFTATASVIGKYKIKTTTTSSDGQTFAGYGWLHVE